VARDVFIGVDGGGTKTAAAAYRGGACIARSLSGPMNYNFIGEERAAEELLAAIRGLHLAPEDIAAVGIGDPSVDDGVPRGDNPCRRFLSGVEQALGVPVYLRSDAYITLFALTRGLQPGVLQLAGTGAMAIAENDRGELKVAGGWGRLTGDEGSGYHIALSGLKAALRAADGIAPPTALTQAACRHFGAEEPRELIGILYGEQPPDIAPFATAVDACAGAGDETARRILQNAARYLAAYTSALVKWSGSTLVGVYGSVLCQNAAVRAAYEEALRQRYPHITVTEPPVSAEEAAALYAAKEFAK